MRNLTKTLAVVSLLIPASAYPLGIGEIKLHSALNQNLDAEISLVLSPGEKLSDVKINLAHPDKFDENGVPWTYFLSKIRFTPVQLANGGAVIKIHSRESLKEPFLNFLLEVTWPKGTLFREFTVLVDPPELYEQASAPVASYEPASSSYQSGATVEHRPASSRRQHTSIKRTQIVGDKYGPTVRNDTLWKVAERVAANEGVSIEQMMIALYEANPRAFYKQNVNALLAGKTLNIPDKEIILKLSRKQAIEEFNRQTTNWKQGLTETVAEQGNVAPSEEKTENQLTLTPPSEGTVTGNQANGTNDKPIQAKEEASTTASTQSATKEEPTTQSEKQAVDNNPKSAINENLKTKIDALEKQMAAMQELIALKDQQLATLQNKGLGQEQTHKTAQDNLPRQKPSVQAKSTATTTVPITDKKAPTVIGEASKDDSSAWLYTGIATVLLATIGFVWWRRRQSSMESNFDTIFTNDNVGKPFNTNTAVSSSADQNIANESLFSPELTGPIFDEFEMDQGEIDPISEADVYLAYGRYQQAEDLMRHALKDQSDRDDFKLKLLEIFYLNQNKQAFENYALELVEAGKQQDQDFWGKVTEMGSEICPASEIFAPENSKKDTSPQSNNNTNIAKNIGISSSDFLDDLDFDLATFEELFENSLSEESNQKDPLKNSLQPAEDDFQNNESIDFDLSSFSDEKNIVNENPANLTFSKNTDENKIESIDFDSDFRTEKPIYTTESNALDNTDQSNDFISSAPNKEMSFGSLDDDFDFNAPGHNIKGVKADFGVSDLTEMDEMETKLDLAIAYIDMSDEEAAKEIALEVLEKGSVEQRKVAQALLDGLSSGGINSIH